MTTCELCGHKQLWYQITVTINDEGRNHYVCNKCFKGFTNKLGGDENQAEKAIIKIFRTKENKEAKERMKWNVEWDKEVVEARERSEMEEEKAKIRERERKTKLKERAEKEYYGKAKTKREPIGEDVKEAVYSKYDNECAMCGRKEGLHIHHKDKESKNNKLSNLILLCGVCHKKIHMKVR